MSFLSKVQAHLSVTANIYGKGKNLYRVEMSGMARMRGYLEVKANSQAEAEELALDHTGDVLWSYEEMDDSTVEAYALKK